MPLGTFSPYLQSERHQHLQTRCSSSLCAALLFDLILVLKHFIRPSSTRGLLFSPDLSIILDQGEQSPGGWAIKRKKFNIKRVRHRPYILERKASKFQEICPDRGREGSRKEKWGQNISQVRGRQKTTQAVWWHWGIWVCRYFPNLFFVNRKKKITN